MKGMKFYEILCSVLNITAAFCEQHEDTVQDCNLSLLSVVYHLILLKCLKM
jgi:hypothetical protein